MFFLNVAPLLVTYVLLLSLANRSSGKFFDGIPGLSQLESLIQIIDGDEEGARETQRNFVGIGQHGPRIPILTDIARLKDAFDPDKTGMRSLFFNFIDIISAVSSSHSAGLKFITYYQPRKGISQEAEIFLWNDCSVH